MQSSEIQLVEAKLKSLKDQFNVAVLADWGPGTDGTWKPGLWTQDEIERLERYVGLLAGFMGGSDKFMQNINGVTFKKSDIGLHGGEAQAHQVSLSTKGTFAAWTVIHELSHAWDGNFGWQLSVKLQSYTGGFTSPLLSYVIKALGLTDASLGAQEDKPGRRGRKPGANSSGYFYGDIPTGSNWMFNRVEDFAESVAMYVAWNNNNELSNWAHARVARYLLPNGTNDPNFGVDNWADYKRYFYPPDGDYTKTKRWQFVDELMKGKIG